MNTAVLYTLVSVFLISLAALTGLLFIRFDTSSGKKLLTFLVSFSAGALLGDVFIHLLPELVEAGQFSFSTSLYILLAIVGFFILEKYLHWHHHHDDDHIDEHHPHPLVFTNLLGDALHNFIDGLIIAGSYLIDINLGIATTIAVALHEIPQEVGDFGVLVFAGLKRSKALLYNFISGLAAVLGAVIALAFAESETLLPILAALGIGSFIYISLADLIPAINKDKKQPIGQLLSFGLGIVFMFLLLYLG